VWDLRLIRQQLAEMGLDWELPPYPTPTRERAKRLNVKVLAAEPLAPSAELDAQAFLDRGLLYLELRQYPHALQDFSRAGTLNPIRAPWKDVVRACSQVLERHPQDAEAYRCRAYAQARVSQWQQALDDYSQAIRWAPERPDFLAYRGTIYLRMGQLEKAAEDFRKAGTLKPREANNLAWHLATAPNPLHPELRLAVELAKQAVQQAPGDTICWNTLGVAHYRLAEWEEAIQALLEAERLAPDEYFSFNGYFLAMCHHQLGEVVLARGYYDRAVRWCQVNQSKLPAIAQYELKAFCAEAEALLNVSASGP
jgi:tetratricopeptide (TPR) repeat protein